MEKRLCKGMKTKDEGSWRLKFYLPCCKKEIFSYKLDVNVRFKSLCPKHTKHNIYKEEGKGTSFFLV
jgi:hypothetical protein